VPAKIDATSAAAIIAGVDFDALRALMMRNGFVAPDEEAAELLEAAGGDGAALEALVARRLTGEPLAWLTGKVEFCGLTVTIHEGVYVPRWHTELVAERAAERLPEGGAAIDLCTGSGAVAKVLAARRPLARVSASDLDERSVACARANGVDAHAGDLFDPLPDDPVDVIVAVVPYVPTCALPLLQRDTFTFETPLAYDGGEDGLDLLRRVLREAPRHLKPAGTLILELGASQAGDLDAEIAALGYRDLREIVDDEGDLRGIEVFAPVG
jgi:release factor glutamine methyltransferase